MILIEIIILFIYWKNQGSPFLDQETDESFQEHNNELLILNKTQREPWT